MTTQIYSMPQAFMDDLQVPTKWRLLGYLNGFFINGLPVYAANKTIAVQLNVSLRSVQNAVKELVDAGIVEVRRTQTTRILYPIARPPVSQPPVKRTRTKKAVQSDAQTTQGGCNTLHGGVQHNDQNPCNTLHPNADNNADIINISSKPVKPKKVVAVKHAALGVTSEEVKAAAEATAASAVVVDGILDAAVMLNKQASELINQMALNIDPKNKLYYARKDMREAAKFVIQHYGYEAALNTILAIPKYAGKVPGFPTITTPAQLRDHWVWARNKLAEYARKTQDNIPL